jgi:hypothetical protein
MTNLKKDFNKKAVTATRILAKKVVQSILKGCRTKEAKSAGYVVTKVLSGYTVHQVSAKDPTKSRLVVHAMSGNNSYLFRFDTLFFDEKTI